MLFLPGSIGEFPSRSVGPEPAMISATGTFAVPPGTVKVPNTVPVPVTSCTLDEAAAGGAGGWARAEPAPSESAAVVRQAARGRNRAIQSLCDGMGAKI